MGSIVVVTGTDTGVGKTLFTALALSHLRASGHHALAMKPFCSGGRQDARLLFRLSENEISLDALNPFHFAEPLAPLVAARRGRARVPLLHEVLERIRGLARQCELLLVEGAGGLLVPLGDSFTLADVISNLRCPVVLIVRNQLGAINHTLLTLRALRSLAVPMVRIVLMERTPRSGLAARTNLEIMKEWSSPAAVFRIPFLGKKPLVGARLKINQKKVKKTLAKILQVDIFASASTMVRESDTGR